VDYVFIRMVFDRPVTGIQIRPGCLRGSRNRGEGVAVAVERWLLFPEAKSADEGTACTDAPWFLHLSL
jgi:hypothetical protein